MGVLDIHHSAGIDEKDVTALALVASGEHILPLDLVRLAHQIVAVVDEQTLGVLARHQAMEPAHTLEHLVTLARVSVLQCL